MTHNSPRRPRRRWIIALTCVVGGLAVLGVVGEVLLRGVIDDRIETATADLPEGITVERDDTPALWQLATGEATFDVQASSEALTEQARTATELDDLEVTPEDGGLVAQIPLNIAGGEQTVDVLLSVTAQGGQAVLRADSVRVAGLSLPMDMVAQQLGITELDRLAEGVAFPEDQPDLTISSARATNDGLELAAGVRIWG